VSVVIGRVLLEGGWDETAGGAAGTRDLEGLPGAGLVEVFGEPEPEFLGGNDYIDVVDRELPRS
jgi:hypothetical protein